MTHLFFALSVFTLLGTSSTVPNPTSSSLQGDIMSDPSSSMPQSHDNSAATLEVSVSQNIQAGIVSAREYSQKMGWIDYLIPYRILITYDPPTVDLNQGHPAIMIFLMFTKRKDLGQDWHFLIQSSLSTWGEWQKPKSLGEIDLDALGGPRERKNSVYLHPFEWDELAPSLEEVSTRVRDLYHFRKANIVDSPLSDAKCNTVTIEWISGYHLFGYAVRYNKGQKINYYHDPSP